MNLDVVIFQATYRTRAVSWELIYNLITTRNIFVNYEHIILFIKRSILTSFSQDEIHRSHALFQNDICPSTYLASNGYRTLLWATLRVPYRNFSIVFLSIVILSIIHISYEIVDLKINKRSCHLSDSIMKFKPKCIHTLRIYFCFSYSIWILMQTMINKLIVYINGWLIRVLNCNVKVYDHDLIYNKSFNDTK